MRFQWNLLRILIKFSRENFYEIIPRFSRISDLPRLFGLIASSDNKDSSSSMRTIRTIHTFRSIKIFLFEKLMRFQLDSLEILIRFL